MHILFFLHPSNPEFDPFLVSGLFSIDHVIAIMFASMFAVILYRFLVNHNQTIDRQFKVLAIIMIVLELVRMLWNIIAADSFIAKDVLPLYTCGIFVFMLPLYAFKTRLQSVALSFLKIAAMGSGLLFLLFPTTALGMFPLWHINTLISMTMHTIMMVVGAYFFFKAHTPIIRKDLYQAFVVVLVFAALSALYNAFDTQANFFFIAYPLANTPLVLLYAWFPQPLYGISILVIHWIAAEMMVLLHTLIKKPRIIRV
jgi:uncharacterized membrane protein YwaF